MKEITLNQYQEGIFDICDSLISDLLKFLKDEGRYKFRMIKYMDDILDTIDSAFRILSKEELETNERIMYYFHRSIVKDYKRLRSKRLSPADSLICIILKFISISESISDNFRYKEQQDLIKDTLNGFFNNIRNKAKYDKLRLLENSVGKCISEKSYGKLRMKNLNIYKVENPDEKTQEIQGEKNTWGTSGNEIEL